MAILSAEYENEVFVIFMAVQGSIGNPESIISLATFDKVY